jgi:serine/threonine-protein kinase RsbW
VTELARRLTTPPDTVDAVHDLLDRLWAAEPTISGEDRMRFETALIELASNVVQHGSKGAAVDWSVNVACDPSSLTAQLVDSAPPASLNVESAITMPSELAEDGRGLAFVRLLVDSATFANTAAGNEWRISKNRAAV